MSPCGHGQSQVWSACRCVCQQENPALKRDNRCVAARAACGVCEVILQQKASNHTLPHTMPPHLNRNLRFYYGKDNNHVRAWMDRLDDSIRAWQTDYSNGFLVAVGTKKFGREVAHHLKSVGVPYRFYHGTHYPDTRPCSFCGYGDDAGAIIHCDQCNAPYFITMAA